MGIPSLQDLMNAEVKDSIDFSADPVPKGEHDGVITGAEVKRGPKGPYITPEVTVHNLDGYNGRKVWGLASFSEKAITMPGGPANLLQSVKDQIGTIPTGLDENEAIAWIAENIRGCAVRFGVRHEQVERNGVKQYLGDGSPEMREKVDYYAAPDADFLAFIQAEADGLDADLPF